MKLGPVLAAGTIGIIGIVGSAGVATADTTSTPTHHDKQAVCAKATSRLPNLQDRITKVDARISSLQTRLTDAQSKKQAYRTKYLQDRIDWANTRHEHLTNVVNRINSRCPA
jgi:peptidoglycan hydrolase CwlO-like protein